MKEIEIRGAKVKCFSTGDEDIELLRTILENEKPENVFTIHHRSNNWADPFYIAGGVHLVNRLGFLVGDVPPELVEKQLSWRWHEDIITAIKGALE